MKLIIDIPEHVYETYKEWDKRGTATVDEKIIAQGTPIQTVTNAEEAEAYPIISKEQQEENWMNDREMRKNCADCRYYVNNYGYGQCYGQKNAPKVEDDGYCEHWKGVSSATVDKMTFTEFLNDKYNTRPDKDNMFGVGISDREFVHFAIKYLLGDNWHVVDPLGHEQINEIALDKILMKHSTKYRKEKRYDT